MTSGAQAENIWLSSLWQASWPSSRLPGIVVAGAQDSSWGGHRLALLQLAAKIYQVGADMDGLACRLHQTTNYG
jgi:hypothetical protein